MADLTLQEAIALALYQQPQNGGGDASTHDAVAVLAMPEMQAIRSALRTMSQVIGENLGRHRGLTAYDALVGHLGGENDTDSAQRIIDWIVGE